MTVPLSVLDRALARSGLSDDAVLREVVDRAAVLEDLGFQRVWVAEHHAVPGIAGSSPALLMSAIAAATSRIRVGAAGFMVPSHPPIVIAEQISTLEALHPGRIDAGLGASTGFTGAVRRALRQDDDAADRFADDVNELTDLLAGRTPVSLRPQPFSPTPLFVFTGGTRLPFAARAGLGVAIGGPAVSQCGNSALTAAVASYRREFRPSLWWEKPHVTVSVTAALAHTEEDARALALPEAWSMVLSRSTGTFDALQPVGDLDPSKLTDQQRHRLDSALDSVVHGTRSQVKDRLERIAATTGADEILVSGGASDSAAGALSDALLADITLRRSSA